LFGIYKYRKEMIPWAVGAVVFLWLALGPSFGLYAIYHAIPAISVIREPGRFDLMATLFIAVLAAFGSKAVFEHLKDSNYKNMAVIVLIAIIAIMFIENNGLSIGKSPYLITTVNIPKLYYQIGNFTGNFTILPLPALPTSTSAPYFFAGKDTYYTTITHKPIVGGYVGGRQDINTTLILYNIPLVIQTSYLLSNGTGYYPSPVTQNYSNQTILTLYNYDTQLIVLHNDAFNQTQLQVLQFYLYNLFGRAVYSDNSTTAFQTTAAINRSVFRSFVAYPVVTQWGNTRIFINGTYQTFWSPSTPGSVILYAPYPKGSTALQVQASTVYINTTVSFTAFSSQPQSLYILTPAGTNNTRTLASVNITVNPKRYTVRIPAVSGALGNILYFYNSNRNTQLLINNITFSR
jgi:hypothetical protein